MCTQLGWFLLASIVAVSVGCVTRTPSRCPVAHIHLVRAADLYTNKRCEPLRPFTKNEQDIIVDYFASNPPIRGAKLGSTLVLVRDLGLTISDVPYSNDFTITLSPWSTFGSVSIDSNGQSFFYCATISARLDDETISIQLVAEKAI
jgi:hypothetical protein